MLLINLARIVTLAAGACASVVPTSKAKALTDIVIFGDSYSDQCNDLRLLLPIFIYPNCPAPPLGRFDGGKVWPEWIQSDGMVPDWRFEDLAFGAATCSNKIFNRVVIPDMIQQIALYQNNFHSTSPMSRIKTDPETTLAVLFIGTNDVQYMLEGTGGPTKETDCIEERFTELHTLGFRRFLLVENINLQDAPMFIPKADATKALVLQNNKQQAALADKLRSRWRKDAGKTTIDIFPAYALFKSMYDNHRVYGFTYTTQCGSCTNPDDHLFFNAVHPSSRAFHIFARKVVRFLRDGARGSDLIDGTEGV